MKKLTLSALAAIAVVGSSYASPATVSSSKDFKQPAAAPQPFFQDTEIALDAFYSFNNAQHEAPLWCKARLHIIHPEYFADGSGGGVGANFFFARYFGLGVEGNWWTGTTDGITQKEHDAILVKGGTIPTQFGKDLASQATANVILRYPMEFTTFGLAPYIFGGGGAAFGDNTTGFPDVGAGMEVRLAPHVGIFADWRWNFMVGPNRNDVNTTRAGLRFVF